MTDYLEQWFLSTESLHFVSWHYEDGSWQPLSMVSIPLDAETAEDFSGSDLVNQPGDGLNNLRSLASAIFGDTGLALPRSFDPTLKREDILRFAPLVMQEAVLQRGIEAARDAARGEGSVVAFTTSLGFRLGLSGSCQEAFQLGLEGLLGSKVAEDELLNFAFELAFASPTIQVERDGIRDTDETVGLLVDSPCKTKKGDCTLACIEENCAKIHPKRDIPYHLCIGWKEFTCVLRDIADKIGDLL